MGGIGSGRGSRWSTKTTTNEVKRLDVRLMRKQGLLKDGIKSNLRWTRNGKPNGEIGFNVAGDVLHLVFNSRTRGEDWQLIEQAVPLDYTPCNYGGVRPWFLCPRCSKRVALLYGADALFLCRHCYNLPYQSQQQGTTDRAINQKHKLGERIFEHYEYGEGYGKKKGMHWKTYERLHKRYKANERTYLSAMTQYLKL